MKRIINVMLCSLLCIGLLVGCGSESTSSAVGVESGNGWSADAAESPEKSDEALLEGGLVSQDRKLIHNAELHLESKQFDETRTQLMQAMEKANGYVEYSSEWGNEKEGNRSAEYTLRIPSQNYDAFLQDAADAGSLLGKNQSVQDVTGQYVDVQARLDSLNVQEQRLMELAAQAQTMEDLLVIEEHLSTVRYQIENYTAQQNAMDNQIDYSTVKIALQEVTVYSPVNHSFGHQISEAVKGSLENFVAGCQDFVLWFIYALPNLLVWGIVIAAAVVIVRKWNTPQRREKRAQKRAHKYQSKAQKMQEKCTDGMGCDPLYPQNDSKEEENPKNS